MNTYQKFVPNVYLAKCEEKHEKGDEILVATKYGKERDAKRNAAVNGLMLRKEKVPSITRGRTKMPISFLSENL